MSRYIYQLPSWVLDDLCRNMDTLSEWDWMQFASYVITDLTQLRKIKSMERVQGVSITRELLWWWGMRQATIQQLVDLLQHLQLYRAAQIILDWKSVPALKPLIPSLDAVKPERLSGTSVRSTSEEQQPQPEQTAASPAPEPAVPSATQQSFLMPQSQQDTPYSLKASLPAPSDSQDFSNSIPKQEKPLNLAQDRLFWSEVDVVQATSNFSQNLKISETPSAVIYRGRRNGMPLVVKKLSEAACSSPGSSSRFFQSELQVCLRCCHPNILPLLGVCTGRGCHGLIHPYMENGSLQDQLQGRRGSVSLPWPQRVSICAGLLRAVEHLHGLDIIHSNIKSSNVLLDQTFTPKLAHPVAHLHPDNKRSKYTMMKTDLFLASAAYLPEDFIRVGQLTKRVDVFSCGIVLAELLTGLPAVDNNRNPVYLKDLLLREIASSTPLLSSRKIGGVEEMAKEICRLHLEQRTGRLPKDCAEALAVAVCLCLRKHNASLAEVCGSVAALEERLSGQETFPESGCSLSTGTSSNTPEETDDVDNSSLSAASSMREAPWVEAASSPLCTEDGEGRSQAGGKREAGLHSEACSNLAPNHAAETSWKIEINEAKRKLMENILLYKEEKVDSIELLGP